MGHSIDEIEWDKIEDLAIEVGETVLALLKDKAEHWVADQIGSKILEKMGPRLTVAAFIEMRADKTLFSGTQAHAACKKVTGKTPLEILKNLIDAIMEKVGVNKSDTDKILSTDKIAEHLCDRYGIKDPKFSPVSSAVSSAAKYHPAVVGAHAAENIITEHTPKLW